MIFYLSKFLWYLFNPFNCILFLLILVLILNFFKFLKFSKIILYFTFLLFFITGALPTGSYLLYLLENNKTIYETKIVCYKCKIDMKLLQCDEEENTITGIKCSKCKSDDVIVRNNMMWD